MSGDSNRMLSGGGPVTDDHRELKDNGQQKGYVVLTPEERAKGYVRPIRRTYIHVGARPKHPTRDLTKDEEERYKGHGYYLFEVFPESESPVTGKFWTLDEMNSGCGTETSMSQDIAETYARDPSFYSGTFCVNCRAHKPLTEFVWKDNPDQQVGS
jgi:hypothetical protein